MSTVIGLGEIAIDRSTGGPIVIAKVELTDPEVAVIVALPCPTELSSPVRLTVATAFADEDQTTEFVRF